MYIFLQRINSSFISCFVMSVVISLLIYILFKIISIVSSNGTFVNSDAISNYTILYPSGTFCFQIYLTNSLVLLIVNSDLLNQPNILPFHKWQCRYQIQQVLMINHPRYQLKVCVLVHSHRICQGKILLGKAFYKHFQSVSILFFSMLLHFTFQFTCQIII